MNYKVTGTLEEMTALEQEIFVYGAPFSAITYGQIWDELLDKYAKKNKYDLYFLTYIDVPWEADDLRDRPNNRKDMFNEFEDALIEHNKSYVILKGDKKERLEQAVFHIDKLLKKRK